MRMALIPWLLSSALVVVPVASAQAETSVACMYMLMRVYKAEMDYCKVPLAKDRDARYQRLKTGLESFIRANAKQDPDKILSGIENSNIKRALAGLKSCNSDDFKFAQQAMEKLTTVDNEKLVTSSLTIKRDPMTGDCSS